MEYNNNHGRLYFKRFIENASQGMHAPGHRHFHEDCGHHIRGKCDTLIDRLGERGRTL